VPKVFVFDLPISGGMEASLFFPVSEFNAAADWGLDD